MITIVHINRYAFLIASFHQALRLIRHSKPPKHHSWVESINPKLFRRLPCTTAHSLPSLDTLKTP